MFQSMKIKTRILGILSVLAVGYLILLAMVQISATATHNRMLDISSALFPAALRIQDAQAAFERMKKHYGDAVVLQDAASLTSAETDAEEAAKALEEVKKSLAAIPALETAADALLTQFTALHSRDHDTYTAILATKGTPTDEMMGQMGALGKDNKALTASMTELSKSIADSFQVQLDSVDTWSKRSKLTGLVMLVFAFLSCTSAWWVIQFKVVKPLRILAARVQDIAEGEGDLTRRLTVEGRNEIDEVGIWLNVFLDKLQDIMRQVKANTQKLTRASEDLKQSSSHMAQGASAQQSQTNLVATAMHEMASAVSEVSRNSNMAAQKSRQASEDAGDGGMVVEQTVTMMATVSASVGRAAQQIKGLGERSNQIGEIINVIDEIAGRTNLLALNAAIEAARAGEQGRGFAVVAGEVRNLAERTTEATKEIAEMIGGLQRDTESAAIAMGEGTVQVQEVMTAVGEAGEKLRMIIGSSEEAAGMVNQIAAAATQQSSATDEVNASVNEIAKISQETSSGARSSENACLELSSLALDLNQLVSKFKVDDENDSTHFNSNYGHRDSYEGSYTGSSDSFVGSGSNF